MHRLRSVLPLLVVLLATPAPSHADEPKTLDEFYDSPQRLQQLKTLGLVILTQADPAVAAKNAAELRKTFWASRPDSGLTPAEATAELAKFDSAWRDVARVVQDRHLTDLNLVGIDPVFLMKAMDWYYGALTPRGPVLIKLSVQFSDDAPMRLFGVQVLTRWDDVKAAYNSFHVRSGGKVLDIHYQTKTTDPADDPKFKL